MGDAFKTWEKNGILWPKEFLGKAFPEARIFTYGYDADVVKLFSQVGKSTIFQHSRSFIQAVHRVRRDHYERPIIFVAHSLGGILVKDGLNWAKAQTGFSAVQVNEVFSATKGVIFLGTPHRGANGQYAEVGEQLRRLVGLFLHDSNPHLLSSLRSNSETLPRISEEFHRLCDQNPFLIFSFVETLPVTTMRGIGRVVDENSGYMGLPREEKDVIPHADHMEMARFSSNNQEGYQKIEDAVRHCIKAANQRRSDRVAHNDEQLDEKSQEVILEFTANSQHLTDLATLRANLLEGTCQWISDQALFERWVSQDTKLLLLIGAAGAGKSHVVAKVVDILKERFGTPLYGDMSTPLIAYFFCRTLNNKKTLLGGLKSMIGQLALLDVKYANELSVLWSRRHTFEDSQPTISWLWHNLLTMSTALAKRRCIFLVIDGLDECDLAERQELLTSAYDHCAKTTGPIIHILCSGRPEVKADMTQIMDNHLSTLEVPTIEISWQTKADIRMLIEKRMARVKFYRDRKLRSRVQNSISDNANGMFLWADLTLKEFLNAKTSQDVESCLSQMNRAQTLDDTYRGIISSIMGDASDLQLKILRETLIWLIFATDVVKYFLLEEAIESAIGTKVFAFSDEIERFGSIIEIGGFQRLRLPSGEYEDIRSTSHYPETNLSKELSSFRLNDEVDDDIYLDDGSGVTGEEVIRIRHMTFEEWYANGADQFSAIWISPQDAHIELLTRCLGILASDESSASCYPGLLSYAQNNWFEHLIHIKWRNVQRDKLMNTISAIYTLFTDWQITRSWISNMNNSSWNKMKSCLEVIVLDLIPSYLELFELNEDTKKWAQNISSSTKGVIDVLYETAIEAAEIAGFFATFPEIGDGMQEFQKTIEGLVHFSNIADGKSNVAFTGWVPWFLRQEDVKFWRHDTWKENKGMKEYILGEFDYLGTPEARYLEALRTNPEEPVISYRLAKCYLVHGSFGDSHACVQRAIDLCLKANQKGLDSALLLEADIYNSSGNHIEAIDKYLEAVQHLNVTALDILASHYASMEDIGLRQWLDLYLEFDKNNIHATFANAILRQPVFSEWHSTFRGASNKLNEIELYIKAYETAIHLLKNRKDLGSIIVQCGCRYHLAQIYAVELNQRALAIPLWTWIINNLMRFTFPGMDNDLSGRLLVLAVEELSYSNVLNSSHPIIYFAETADLNIFQYSRLMILLGKGIEQQNYLHAEAAKLYRKVLIKVLRLARQTEFSPNTMVVLGNALLALNYLDDAARVLGWACRYTSSSDDSTISSKDSRQSITANEKEDDDKEAPTSISWDVWCDGCMAERQYSESLDIFGPRYKCCVCAEIDLCERCFTAWTNSDKLKLQNGMRRCSPNHEFLKIPDPSRWPGTREEAKLMQSGKVPKSIRDWLEELIAKYDLGK
ncbi:hypothetical protein F5884DRAFT_860088 [Xylogone sp. PMI_703]|nr:hypothetical protein F5884DRAFT_860088 [Xylogone sp. PMI_703]